MAFNRKAKLRNNIEAIRTVFELDNAKRQATDVKSVRGKLQNISKNATTGG
ncbi:MAG: hypothetical protein VB110_07050 [Bacteroidales bacterium]|nr:hypothetical protein [Bacteroidales bacterium]